MHKGENKNENRMRLKTEKYLKMLRTKPEDSILVKINKFTKIKKKKKEKLNNTIYNTYPAPFDKVGDHDNNSNALFPNHSPEAVESGWQRSLGSDVSLRYRKSIDVIGIDVIDILLLARHLE